MCALEIVCVCVCVCVCVVCDGAMTMTRWIVCERRPAAFELKN